MTVINTNTASINAQYNLNKVNKEMEAAMEQLSSGKRINSAADDAAGLAISTRMDSQVKGIGMAIRMPQMHNRWWTRQTVLIKKLQIFCSACVSYQFKRPTIPTCRQIACQCNPK